jgi:hypothetical protein
MRWTKKEAVRSGAYTATYLSDVFNLEPSDVSDGIYIMIKPSVADSQWNVNIQMPVLATGVYTEIANLDDATANTNEKGIRISAATIASYLPRMKIQLEKAAGASSVTTEVNILSVID